MLTEEHIKRIQHHFDSLDDKYQGHFSNTINHFIRHVRNSTPAAHDDKHTFPCKKRRVLDMTVREHKRLDSLARLLVGDEICAAVTIHDNKLYVATNQHAHTTKSPLYDRIVDILHFNSNPSHTLLSEEEIPQGCRVIENLFESRRIQLLQESQASCDHKSNKKQAGLKTPPAFWVWLDSLIQRTAHNAVYKLLRGHYDVRLAYADWDDPTLESDDDGEPDETKSRRPKGVLNRVFARYKLGEDPHNPKLSGGRLIPDEHIVSNLKKHTSDAQFDTLPKGQIKKSAQVLIKKCLSEAIRMTSDFILFNDYASKPDSPIYPMTQGIYADYIVLVDGFEEDNEDQEVHTEMKILSYAERNGFLGEIDYIGISKLSCPYCKLVLDQYTPYIDAEGPDAPETSMAERVRGHHSNFNTWPLSKFHRRSETFMRAFLGSAFDDWAACNISLPGKTGTFKLHNLLLFILRHLVKFKESELHKLGVTEPLGHGKTTSLTPQTVTSIGKMNYPKAVEYIECTFNDAALNTLGRPSFLSGHQRIYVPNYGGETLIYELERFEDFDTSHDIRYRHIGDNGELLKKQMDLYKMLLLCQRESDDPESVVADIMTLMKEFQCGEPEDGMPDIWSFVNKEENTITWNDILRFFYQQDTTYDKILSGESKEAIDAEPDDVPVILLKPRWSQIGIDDIIEQFGETLFIEGALQPLYIHMGKYDHLLPEDEHVPPSTPFYHADSDDDEWVRIGTAESKAEPTETDLSPI